MREVKLLKRDRLRYIQLTEDGQRSLRRSYASRRILERVVDNRRSGRLDVDADGVGVTAGGKLVFIWTSGTRSGNLETKVFRVSNPVGKVLAVGDGVRVTTVPTNSLEDDIDVALTRINGILTDEDSPNQVFAWMRLSN